MTLPDLTLPALTPDCQACDALCCVLLAFDASAAFAFDKPACVACRHLTDGNLCRIHSGLADQGFKGCVSFDCHGAGQKVSQAFKGRSWRQDPSQFAAIDAAFRLQRRLHEALALLVQSANLPLTAAQDATRQTLMHTLTAAPDPEPPLAETARFFASLRSVTQPRR